MSPDPKPMAPALVPSPPAHADTRAEPIPRCRACGAVHGGIGAGRLCLENEVGRLRALLAKLGRADLEALERTILAHEGTIAVLRDKLDRSEKKFSDLDLKTRGVPWTR